MLNVQPAWSVAEETASGLSAMADAEIYFGILRQIGLAVFAISEGGHVGDAEAKAQPSQQLCVAHSTLTPPLQMFIAQSLFASPFRKRGNELSCLFLAQLCNMVVDAEDFPFRFAFHGDKGTNKSGNIKMFRK